VEASFNLREAHRGDIPVLMDIRANVRENRLMSCVVTAAEYEQSMFVDGRCWIAECEGVIAGFACGRLPQRDVWGLFLRPEFEGRGIGNTLMEQLENWMFAQGIERIILSTDRGTRAERVYRRRGWWYVGVASEWEGAFELLHPRLR